MRDIAFLLEASYRRVDRAMLPLLWVLFLVALVPCFPVRPLAVGPGRGPAGGDTAYTC